MSELLIADKLTGERLHNIPESWLGARVVGWMFRETLGNWWIAAYLSDGKLKQAASRTDYAPSMLKQEFALRVLRHVNKQCNFGGVWLAGFLDKDYLEEFYLLWKDQDGDIRVPIEFPLPFETLLGWGLDSFCMQADEAHTVYAEWQRDMEYSKSQQIKRAQGERPDYRKDVIGFDEEDL